MDKKSNKHTYTIVAIVVVLIAAIAYFGLEQKQKSPQDLFAENFKPYQNVIEPITKSEEELNIKELAFYNYETGQYSKAIFQFDTMFANSNEGYYLLYKGNALLKLQKYKEAIRVFEIHQVYNDSFKDTSKWYLALAYIKTNQISKGKALLAELVANKAYNYKKAKAILSAL